MSPGLTRRQAYRRPAAAAASLPSIGSSGRAAPDPGGRLRAMTRRQFEASVGAAFAGLVSPGRAPARPAARGITGVVRASALRGEPRSAPPGSRWRYGLGYPFQVAPRLAGLFCNIKGTRGNDFEEGSDVVLFDDLAGLRVEAAVAVSRNHREPNPYTEPPGQTSILVKYPVGSGFVPLGAKRRDGSPHPGAGTGFGVVSAEAWPLAGNKSHGYASGRTGGPGTYEYLEVQQYRFDGRAFAVERTDRVFYDQLLPGWTIYNPGLSTAIADGDDLLQAFASSPGADRRRHNYDGVDSGVLRWRRGPKGWQPVEFLPATGPGPKGFIEPTLIRALDGALLLLARWGSDEEQHDIRIWRSTDAGRSWRKVLHVAGVVASTPISLNRADDGTPYVATNPYEILLHPVRDPEGVWARRRSRDAQGRVRGGGSLREKLALFPVKPDLADVEPAILARDPHAEFGLPPSGYQWDLDHPVSATVQLADGDWHNVLCYRLCDLGETRLGTDPAPQTGMYADEVLSAGPPVPIWNF